MKKLEAIKQAKTFRQDLDAILQRMKAFRLELFGGGQSRAMIGSEPAKDAPPEEEEINDLGETIAQHTISIRDLESAIMRQGMTLKNIGNPNPYPESYNPGSSKVEPTADNLKL